MLIAQITDTHVTSPGTLLAGRLDSAERLSLAVETLHAFRPDCVLATGDLTDRGEPAAYAELRRRLAPLALPVYAIPGNHDRREAMRQAFADCAWMPQQPDTPLCYALRIGSIALIALDTLVEGEDYGELGAAQLHWLGQRLHEFAGVPVLIMLHHPPVNSGIAAMDGMKLKDSAPFGEIVCDHPNVERILCGHLHRSMHVRWRNTLVSVPASTGEQLKLDLGRSVPLGTVQEPPGLQLHYWDSQDGLITHNVAIGAYPGPFHDG